MSDTTAPKGFKLIWSCPHCGTVLHLWQVRCTNCHKTELSWLHVAAALGVLGVGGALYFLGVF